MTAVKERPILFSGPMVRALLAGRKTQTRRVVKPQPPATAVDAGHIMSGNPASNGVWLWLDSTELMDASPIGDGFRCPYGVPADRLWVKETHAIVPRTAYAMSEGVQQTLRPDDEHDAAIYAAGWERSRPGRWRPSIHMPRWASRLTLAITDVRVERLQDITAADAHAEGCDPVHMQPGGATGNPSDGWLDYREGYRSLWNQINGPDSWDANPWVWAITFDVEARP